MEARIWLGQTHSRTPNCRKFGLQISWSFRPAFGLSKLRLVLYVQVPLMDPQHYWNSADILYYRVPRDSSWTRTEFRTKNMFLLSRNQWRKPKINKNPKIINLHLVFNISSSTVWSYLWFLLDKIQFQDTIEEFLHETSKSRIHRRLGVQGSKVLEMGLVMVPLDSDLEVDWDQEELLHRFL